MKTSKKGSSVGHIEWRKNSARIIYYYKGDRYVLPLGPVSEGQAEIARFQFVADVLAGKVLPQSSQPTALKDDMTFAQFAAVWVEDRRDTAGEKTFHEDNRRLQSRILPVLGSKTMKSLTGFEVDQFIKKTLAKPWKNGDQFFKPLGDQSRKHYFRQLHLMFEQAKAWGYISSNPMSGLKAPSAKNKPTKYYSAEELTAFWKKFSSPFAYRPLVIHIAWTLGLRREEICGLRWSDLDFKSLTATIQNCRIYIPGNGVAEKGTKNNQIRTVGITPQVSQMLLDYKADYDQQQAIWKKQWLGKDLVFVNFTEKGTPYHPSTLDYWLTDFLSENNLPDITLHGFRHTMATLLHEAGMDAVTISELLGHSTKQSNALGGYGMAPRVTRTYLHKSKDAAKKMTDIMTKIFDQILPSKAKSSQESSQAD